MAVPLGVGDALMIPSGSDKHMFVVLATAHHGKSHETHLLANFSSVKAGIYHDPACVAEAGAHAFLKARSFVPYQHARIEMASDLAAGLRSGRYEQIAPVSSALLLLMRKGISKSSHVARKYRRYFDDHG
jgi:hypothetical protein